MWEDISVRDRRNKSRVMSQSCGLQTAEVVRAAEMDCNTWRETSGLRHAGFP